MKRLMRLVAIVVAFTQTVYAFTFWNGPSIIRQQNGELINRKKTLKIVLENQIYRVYSLQEGQSVDDVAIFAKAIFEQEVKPAFDRNEVTPDILNLWTFCANAMLYRAEMYMRNIPWSAKIREARDKRMESSYQWEVRGKEVENGLSQFTKIDQPLNNWIACYNDEVVKETFSEPDPLYEAFQDEKRNTSDTMEDLTRQELDNLVFCWHEKIKAEWKSQDWIINHPVMMSIGFGGVGFLGGAVVGGLSAMVASGVSTGAATGAAAGTTGFPVVGTIIGAVGGAAIGVAGGVCCYYYRKGKEVRCKSYVGGNALKKWYDVETKRDKYLRDALHQYKELRDSINAVFACLDTFKEKFGGVGDSLDVIDRHEENSTRRSEMLSDLEDMYVNYPLMIELVEGMVYVQFCLNALQENSETFSDERAVDKEELRTTFYETLCYVKRHFAAYFPNTTMMFMNVLTSRYANSCRLPFVTTGRPASLSWKKENDEMEQWMRNRLGYTIGFSPELRQRLWVAYRLVPEDVASDCGRIGSFQRDDDLRQVLPPRSYNGSGYERGHLAPSIDMQYDSTVSRQSFWMGNISPQTPHLNRGK